MKQTALLLLLLFLFTRPVLAGPQSDNFELVEYGFGSGSVASASSDNYSLFGTVGEVSGGQANSLNYGVNDGLIFTMQANLPPAPTFTNPGDTYDRLHFAINTGSNPADTRFAIAISTDDFATDTRFIQNDNTIGDTLGSEDWQTYTEWGSGSGEYVTGLLQNTTYTVKVKAEQGNFTETDWGPTASVATSVPSLTFGVDSHTVTFDNLNSGNSYTDSTQTTTLTTSTNAYNGYVVNARALGPLTYESNTILDFISPNSAPTSWTGTGFGYTTDDSDLTGGTADRFTNGGPNYAGFTTSSPGDPVADHAGPVTTPITDETFTVSYRVTADSTQTAGTYSTTVMYIVVPEY